MKNKEQINQKSDYFQGLIQDATAAQTMPQISVSSTSNKDDEKGFKSHKSFRDGGGYEDFEVFGDRDKDKYGYTSEIGFGKRSSNLNGKGPKINDNHAYKKTTKLGNGWDNKDAFKTFDILDDSSSSLLKKIEEIPKT